VLGEDAARVLLGLERQGEDVRGEVDVGDVSDAGEMCEWEFSV
jgi:hypothetical protein